MATHYSVKIMKNKSHRKPYRQARKKQSSIFSSKRTSSCSNYIYFHLAKPEKLDWREPTMPIKHCCKREPAKSIGPDNDIVLHLFPGTLPSCWPPPNTWKTCHWRWCVDSNSRAASGSCLFGTSIFLGWLEARASASLELCREELLQLWA